MFGPWAKGQNSLERWFHYCRLPFDITCIKGPKLAPPSKLINSKKRKAQAWNEDRKRKRKEGIDLDEYPGQKCIHCLATGITDMEKHNKQCEYYKVFTHNSVRYPNQKRRKVGDGDEQNKNKK